MSDITYVDRLTQQEKTEKIYGKIFVQILYGNSLFSRLISSIILPIIARVSFLSQFYGMLQKSKLSRWKIKPFIKAFHIDPFEFADPVEAFDSFNAFFIRKLKKEVRPFAQGEDVLIMPADARYLVFPNIADVDGFWLKGKKFSLQKLVQDDLLAKRFERGAMVIARLCPIDYHRFHFPCDVTPGVPQLINGSLYSVNPIALKRNIEIMTENKRVMTVLESEVVGTILYLEIGATNVGSIHQTFTPKTFYKKGEEKGYFSFGGSCLVLFFEQGQITFDADLLKASSRKIEVRGLLGQSLGRKRRV